MRRHTTLVPLTRDHHHILLFAQSLRSDGPPTLRALVPKTVSQRIEHVRSVFSHEISPHFRLEEDVLFPAVRGVRPELDRLLDEIVDDHRAIEGLLESISDAEKPDEVIDALGRCLELHVRREERALFEKIQECVPDETLAALSDRIALLDRSTLRGQK
jgi:iron-sulfur cluster repair protein YtfE (RIC family)